MEITRKSALTGITRTRDLPVTEHQLRILALYGPSQAHLIFPDLNALDIEFITIGAMPEDWAQALAA
jgi:hypothetical protein